MSSIHKISLYIQFMIFWYILPDPFSHMEMENDPKWKETNIGGRHVPLNHDYGRKGIPNSDVVKGQLGVPYPTVYPWYLLCSRGIFGDEKTHPDIPWRRRHFLIPIACPLADATGSSSLGLLHEESLASRRKGVVYRCYPENLTLETSRKSPLIEKKKKNMWLNQSSMTLGLHVHKFRVKNTWWRILGQVWWLVVGCWFWVGFKLAVGCESFPKPHFWS